MKKLLLVLPALLILVACGPDHSKVQKAIETYLGEKNIQAKDLQNITVQMVHLSPQQPGKAYTSAVITYNFASAEGKPQKEYSGFIMSQDGGNWKVENQTKYTDNTAEADIFLAGRKR